MDKISFKDRLIISIYKPKNYILLYKDRFFRSLIYIVIISFILGIISFFNIFHKYNKFINSVEIEVKNNFPDFSFHNGILHVNQKDEIVIKNSGGLEIIIDTRDGEGNIINNYLYGRDKVILVLKDKIIYKSKDKIDETQLDTFKKITLNKEKFIKYVFKFKLGLITLIIIFPFLIFIINIFSCFLLTLLGVLITSVLKIKISFVDLFKLSIYSNTFPSILKSIFMLFGFSNNKFNYIYIILGSFYLIFSIKYITINLEK